MTAKPTESAVLVDHLFRHQAGELVARLVARYGFDSVDLIEDCVQDALLKALRVWPIKGVPDVPTAWLYRVASNRLLDHVRRQQRWVDKARQLTAELDLPASDPEQHFAAELGDETLRLLFACCHPQIAEGAQIALTLKLVGGFSFAEISRAILVSEGTVRQRVARAKKKLQQADDLLKLPVGEDLDHRANAVLSVIYLMFNEGYSATAGDALLRNDLCIEAIRLTETLLKHPVGRRPAGQALMALMCFQSARAPARVDDLGGLVLLADQDRSRWQPGLIAKGLTHFEASAKGTMVSRFHWQAEISACHILAPSYEETDWERILACYDALHDSTFSPVVAVNRCVAVWHVHGPEAALNALLTINRSDVAAYYPYFVVKARLLEALAQDSQGAWQKAIEVTSNQRVADFLQYRSELSEPDDQSSPAAN